MASNKQNMNQTAFLEMLPKQISFWFGLGFFLCVLFAIGFGVYQLLATVHHDKSTPVSALLVQGEIAYTTKAEIKASVKTLDLGNFFQIDVNNVQAKVEALPWVYSASVRKQWPSTLQIYVVDQQPVASWNGNFLLNEQGHAFQADKNRIGKTIPEFYGPEGSEQLALENYQNLNELLSIQNLQIKELILSERFAWQLTLNDGVLLNLGREERVKRVQRFIDVYQQIQRQQSSEKVIDYIDLRYDTGLAVGWKNSHQEVRV